MNFRRQRTRFVTDQERKVFGQTFAGPTSTNILVSCLCRYIQNPHPGGGRLKRVTACQLCFVAVCVKLHLTQHEATDSVSDLHQRPKDSAGKPNTSAGNVQYDANAKVRPTGPFLKFGVPGIPLVNYSSKPEIDFSDNVGQTHSCALSEMAELMCQNAGELPHIQPSSQGKADGQNQIFAPQAATKARRGVNIAIHVDSTRSRSADQRTNLLDEGK